MHPFNKVGVVQKLLFPFHERDNRNNLTSLAITATILFTRSLCIQQFLTRSLPLSLSLPLSVNEINSHNRINCHNNVSFSISFAPFLPFDVFSPLPFSSSLFFPTPKTEALDLPNHAQ